MSDIKTRIQKLEKKVAELTTHNSIISFSSQEEYETAVMIAAKHNMTLSNYCRACVIKISNDFLAAEEANAKAAKAESEEVVEEAVVESKEEGEPTNA